MNPIKLKDILNLKDLDNVRIRFNLMFGGNWNPVEVFKRKDGMDKILEGNYWNYHKRKSYKEGQISVGFIKIPKDNLWLLVHIGRVTKDLGIQDGIGYEYEALKEYEKYFGRIIVRFKNRSQNMIRKATSVIDECDIAQILPDVFDNDIFPGYDKVSISWEDLARVIDKDTWRTALGNQKGVYLITDTSNGRMYVGSAYGDDMILNRWKDYVRTGNGGNKELKKLNFDYIKKNFKYSILEIFKGTTDSEIIIERESWWKEILLSRKFGYNAN